MVLFIMNGKINKFCQELMIVTNIDYSTRIPRHSRRDIMFLHMRVGTIELHCDDFRFEVASNFAYLCDSSLCGQSDPA